MGAPGTPGSTKGPVQSCCRGGLSVSLLDRPCLPCAHRTGLLRTPASGGTLGRWTVPA